MLKIMSAIFVAGCLADGYLASEADKWDFVIGYCLVGAVGAAILTGIWAITAYNIKALLGTNKERKDLPGGLIATSLAFPGAIVALMFVACAVIAGLHGKFDYGLGLTALGGVAQCILTGIWCATDYNYCEREINGKSRY
jgi:hypothetical protein